MKKLVALLFLIHFLVQKSHAQKPKSVDLLADSTVSWVADFEMDLRFGMLADASLGWHQTQATSRWNALAVRKMIQKEERNGFSLEPDRLENYWSQMVEKWMRDSSIAVFEDAFLQKRLSENERKMARRSTNLRSEQLIGARVRHRIFYSECEKTFGLQPISWSPLFGEFEKAKIVSTRPIFWFAIFEAEKTDAEMMIDPDFEYIFETRSLEKAVLKEKLIDRKGHFDFFEWVKNRLEAKDSTLLNAIFEPMKYVELEENADTVVRYSPINQEELIVIERTIAKMEGWASLQFVVRWFYDTRRRQLFCRFIGLAPVMQFRSKTWSEIDPEMKKTYARPVFFIKDE